MGNSITDFTSIIYHELSLFFISAPLLGFYSFPQLETKELL